MEFEKTGKLWGRETEAWIPALPLTSYLKPVTLSENGGDKSRLQDGLKDKEMYIDACCVLSSFSCV